MKSDQIHFAFAISNPTYFQDALLDSTEPRGPRVRKIRLLVAFLLLLFPDTSYPRASGVQNFKMSDKRLKAKGDLPG